MFVAMLFTAAAFVGELIPDMALQSAAAPGPDTPAVGRQVTGLLVHVYAICACVRDAMAAVFTMSTATITLQTAVVPRWIGMLGFAVAVVLLVSVDLSPWVEPLFPAWILLLSIDILRTGLRVSRHHQAPGRRDRVGHGPDASASRLPTAASSAPGRHLEPPSRQRRRGRRRQAHATRVCLSGFLRESITRPSPR